MRGQGDAHWEWSVFWRSDQLRSCVCEAGGAADDSIAAAWRAFFDALPAAARILDLATGNGVLATLAAGVSQSRGDRFDIHGVDAADVDPARFVPSAANLLNDVCFHPKTQLERLPFADDTFDAVVSQYGIEYSDRSRSLAEASRVLKPGGQFRLLVHAADSVLAERCELQHRQATTILGSELFPSLARMLLDIASAESSNSPAETAAAQQSIGKLGSLVTHLETGFSTDADHSLVDRVLAAVRSLPELRKSNDPAMLLNMAGNIRTLLDAQARRLHAMKRSALSEQDALVIVSELSRLTGSEARRDIATGGESGHCVGYWISGEKSRRGGGSAVT